MALGVIQPAGKWGLEWNFHSSHPLNARVIREWDAVISLNDTADMYVSCCGGAITDQVRQPVEITKEVVWGTIVMTSDTRGERWHLAQPTCTRRLSLRSASDENMDRPPFKTFSKSVASFRL